MGEIDGALVGSWVGADEGAIVGAAVGLTRIDMVRIDHGEPLITQEPAMCNSSWLFITHARAFVVYPPSIWINTEDCWFG